MASQADRYETIIRVAEDDDRSAGDTLIEIIKDMDARLSASEEQSYSIEEFENELKSYGEDKIDLLLLPIYQQIKTKADLGSILSATTLSQISATTGQQSCVISPESAWPMFAPTQFMTFNAIDNPNLQLYAEKVSYDKTTGVLIFFVKNVIGTGVGVGWNIAVAAQMLPANALVITPTANISGLTLQAGLQQISDQLGVIPSKANSANAALTGATQAQDVTVTASTASPFRIIRDTGADQVSVEYKTPVTGSMFLGFAGNTLRVSPASNLNSGIDVSLKGHGHTVADVNNLQAMLDAKASLAGADYIGPVSVYGVAGTLASPLKVYRPTGADQISIEFNSPASGSRYLGFSGNVLKWSNTNDISSGISISMDGHVHTIANVTGLQTALDAKVNIASPVFSAQAVSTTSSSAPLRLVRTINDLVGMEFNTTVSGARFLGFNAGKLQTGTTAALGTNVCVLGADGRIDATAARVRPASYLEQTTVRTVSSTTQNALSTTFDYVATNGSTTSNLLAIFCLSGSIIGSSNAADDYSYTIDLKRYDGTSYVSLAWTSTYGDVDTGSIATTRKQNFVHTMRPIVLTRSHVRSDNTNRWSIQIHGAPDYTNFVLSTIKSSVVFIEFEP